MGTAMALNGVVKWLLGPEPPPRPASVSASASPERFGDAMLESTLGDAVLDLSPLRRNFRTAIRDLLSALSKPRKHELVDRLLGRFALYVYDLPASESSHHAERFGLLDHALKVAHAVLEGVSARNFKLSHDPVVDQMERPAWVYAGFVAGLLHDVGKVLDMEVSLPDGKGIWRPDVEPLALFLRRNGLSETTPEMIHFHRGRGFRDHEWRMGMFYPLILPPSAIAYLDGRLSLVIQAYIGSTAAPSALPAHIPKAAVHVASLLRDCDVADSKAALAEKENVESGAAPEPSPKQREEEENTPGCPVPSSASAPADVPAAGTASATSAPAAATAPVSSPADPEPPSIGIAEYFANAFQLAIAENHLPINSHGGVYVDREFFYIVVPSGLSVILNVMRLRWTVEDGRVNELFAKTSPDQAVIRMLAEKDWLLEGKGGASFRHEAEIAMPTGEMESCEVIALRRKMVQPALPMFQGRIALRDGGRDPLPPRNNPKASPSVTPKLTPVPPPPPRIPATPDVRPAVGRESGDSAPRPLPSKKSPRIRDIEMPRLVETLRGLLNVHPDLRNNDAAVFFVRPDFVWCLHPDLSLAVAGKLGITYDESLRSKFFQGIIGLPGFVPLSPKRFVLSVRVRPEAVNPRHAFRIRTESLLSKAELDRIGFWPHEINVTNKAPADGVPPAGQEMAS